MNGGHDLGGMHGLGPVDPEPESEEPVFHAVWERRAFALNLATGFLGKWNIDQGRHARERQHPADYLRNTYYENWLAGLETLLVEAGLVTPEELESGVAEGRAEDVRVLLGENVEEALSKGGPVTMDIPLEASFRAGDRVRSSISIRSAIRARRDMRGARSEPWHSIAAFTSSRTAMRKASKKVSASIALNSTAGNFGARRVARVKPSASICGSHISRLPNDVDAA